jgi:hypothetical protein
MVLTQIVALATESEGGGIHPWIVGVGIFALLALCLIAVVSFGGGRDHS